MKLNRLTVAKPDASKYDNNLFSGVMYILYSHKYYRTKKNIRNHSWFRQTNRDR